MSDEKKLSQLAHDHIYGTRMLPDSQYPRGHSTPLNGVANKPSSPDTWAEWEWVRNGKPKVNKGIS